MKKTISPVLYLIFSAAVLLLSGCSRHYTQDEAEKWFRENVVDAPIDISVDYTEEKGADGYTDHVWTAHLKDLPQVEFELISDAGYSLWSTYSMDTTYHYEMGKYYLQEYRRENRESIPLLISSRRNNILSLGTSYKDREELEQILGQMETFSGYLSRQKYPCEINYSVRFNELRTLVNGEYPDTFSNASSVPELRDSALKNFAEYAVVYQLNTDQFSEEELIAAADNMAAYHPVVTGPDGISVCYDDLLALYYDDAISFGCLYEILVREGFSDIAGSPESFKFTGTDGKIYEFSYDFSEQCTPGEMQGLGLNPIKSFYYIRDGEKISLNSCCGITSEVLQQMTGLTFQEFWETEPENQPESFSF